MIEEVKMMLTLFGIPYIEAAAEAEAQCAVLEQLGYTYTFQTDPLF